MGSSIEQDNVSFWKGLYDEGYIHWHKTDVNPTLLKHQDKLDPEKNGQKQLNPRVLVPLCGKSLDMVFLNKQLSLQVIGVEGVEDAITTFGEENSMDLIRRSEVPDWIHFMSKGDDYQLLVGDFFFLKPEVILGSNPIRFVYDRASLIAIRPEQRGVYVDAIKRVIDMNNFTYLLIVVEYDTNKGAQGPPFCVTEDEVTSLYGSWSTIQRLGSNELPNFKPGRTGVDVGIGHEVVYLIRNK